MPLPDCLQSLLGRNLLRMDRRELLAKSTVALQKDDGVAELFAQHDAALKHHFLKVCSTRGADVHNSFVSAAAFISQLKAAQLTRAVRVPPPPEMARTMPEVTCNFSWIDARLAVALAATASAAGATVLARPPHASRHGRTVSLT